MGDAVERDQMMLAGGVHRDLFDEHQFVMLFIERGVQDVIGIGVEAGEDLLVGARHPGRGIPQTLPVGILTDRTQQFANRGFGARLIESGRSNATCWVFNATSEVTADSAFFRQPFAGGLGRFASSLGRSPGGDPASG